MAKSPLKQPYWIIRQAQGKRLYYSRFGNGEFTPEIRHALRFTERGPAKMKCPEGCKVWLVMPSALP